MQRGDRMLTLPAEEGARQLVLILLADAETAATRLARATGAEPLHDFRVAVRRLRSLMRALRPWLPHLKRRHERRLGRLARSTNQVRDAQVHLAWLRGPGRQVAIASRRAGYELVVSRLETRLHQGPLATELVERFRRLGTKLTRRLHRSVPAGPDALGVVMAKLLRAQREAFTTRMALVGGAADQEGAHRARIEGKRLRYLLEPTRSWRSAGARRLLARLKDAQTALGELHDAHVLSVELADALSSAPETKTRRPVPQADPRPGIVALAVRLTRHRNAMHAAVERQWRASEMAQLAQDVEAVAAALETATRGET